MTWQLCAWLSRSAGAPIARPVLRSAADRHCWRCATARWTFTRHNGLFSVQVCGTCGTALASAELTAFGPTAWVSAAPARGVPVGRDVFGQPLVLVTAPKPPELGELHLRRGTDGEWWVSITFADGALL